MTTKYITSCFRVKLIVFAGFRNLSRIEDDNDDDDDDNDDDDDDDYDDDYDDDNDLLDLCPVFSW